MKNSLKSIILLSLFVLTASSSCSDEEALEPVRLFRPVSADIESRGTWFKAEWNKIKGAVSYTAEISKDSFETSYRTVEVIENNYMFENLDELTTYFFRLKANAPDTVFSSRWAYLGKVWIGKIPSILKPQSLKDATSTSVIVRWEVVDDFPTRIKVTLNSDGSVVQELDLTEGDINSSSKLITGLNPSTLYKIFIYNEDTSMGSELFFTRSAS